LHDLRLTFGASQGGLLVGCEWCVHAPHFKAKRKLDV
jgi:hypothetical protein